MGRSALDHLFHNSEIWTEDLYDPKVELMRTLRLFSQKNFQKLHLEAMLSISPSSITARRLLMSFPGLSKPLSGIDCFFKQVETNLSSELDNCD